MDPIQPSLWSDLINFFYVVGRNISETVYIGITHYTFETTVFMVSLGTYKLIKSANK